MARHLNAYATFAKAGMSARELEASALLKAAANLTAALAGDDAARAAAITHNRKLWTVLAAAVGDETSTLPDGLRASILSLANFVFNTSTKALTSATGEGITGLIAINRDLAAGLRGG